MVDKEKVRRYEEMKDDLIKKLTSRKFWLCVAAFLGSVAASISGIATGNQTIATIGVIAGVLSAAIYAAAEAYVDARAVNAQEADNESEEST